MYEFTAKETREINRAEAAIQRLTQERNSASDREIKQELDEKILQLLGHIIDIRRDAEERALDEGAMEEAAWHDTSAE